MSDSAPEMHGGDTEWLGLVPEGDGRWSFELTKSLSRFDGKFFGGTGIAVATALLEAATGRHARWCTVQFASTTDTGAEVDCEVEVLAEGRRTSQIRITGRVGDSVLFTALGAAGVARPEELAAQFGSMPDVDPPEAMPPWNPRGPVPIDTTTGWFALVDIREAKRGSEPGAIWARLRSRPLTRGALGFLADMVPSAVVRAAGRAGAGTSLDNTMRYGSEPEGEWLLLDFDPYFIEGGYVHGGARVWSHTGALLAVASQTASQLLFD